MSPAFLALGLLLLEGLFRFYLLLYTFWRLAKGETVIVEYIILPKDRSQLPDVSGLARQERMERILHYFEDLANDIEDKFPEVEITEVLALCVFAKMPEELAAKVAEAFDCSLIRADTEIFPA